MKYILTAFLILLFTAYSIAQLSGQAKLDSLIKELPKAKADTNHVILLEEISYEYSYVDPVKGLGYGKKALKLAKDIKWKKGEARAYHSLGINSMEQADYSKAIQYLERNYNISIEIEDIRNAGGSLINIGVIHYSQSEYLKAIEYYERALEIFEKLDDKNGIIHSLINMGNCYNSKSDYPKALNCYLKTLELSEEIGDQNVIGMSLNNIATIYISQLDYQKALEYQHKALRILEEHNNKGGIANSLSNIGYIHKLQSEYEKALEYHLRSLEINEERGNKAGLAASLNNVGSVYAEMSEYPKALEYYFGALQIQKEIKNKGGVAICLGDIGLLYYELSQDSVNISPDKMNEHVSIQKEINLNKAISYLQESIYIAEEIGELEDRIGNLSILAEAFKQKGMPWKALEAFEEYKLLNDSVFSQDKSKEIGKLEAEREQLVKENKEREDARILAEQISSRNTQQYLAITMIILFFGFILVMNGRMRLPERIARGLIFVTFILLFEFILVVIDPYTDDYSEGQPLLKLAINLAIAFVLYPMHQFFSQRVTARLLK